MDNDKFMLLKNGFLKQYPQFIQRDLKCLWGDENEEIRHTKINFDDTDLESTEKTFRPFLTCCNHYGDRHAFEFIESKDTIDMDRLEALINDFSELTYDGRKLHIICFERDAKEIKKNIKEKFSYWKNFHIVKI